MTRQLTPEGKIKLEEELKNLIAKRPAISKRIEIAKDMGDLKENAEYHDAKDEQGMMEGRIREIEDILANSVVVEKIKSSDTVNLGSKIKIEVNNNEKNYTLVGANEADPLKGLISNESPLGEALMGHRVGDEVEVEVPVGKIIYKIKEII